MFSNSRGLAQITSVAGDAVARYRTLSATIGTGSRPVSAIRPAKIDTSDGAPPARAAADAATCWTVKTAVTLIRTPSCDRRWARSAVGRPAVSVTVILT